MLLLLSIIISSSSSSGSSSSSSICFILIYLLSLIIVILFLFLFLRPEVLGRRPRDLPRGGAHWPALRLVVVEHDREALRGRDVRDGRQVVRPVPLREPAADARRQGQGARLVAGQELA